MPLYVVAMTLAKNTCTGVELVTACRAYNSQSCKEARERGERSALEMWPGFEVAGSVCAKLAIDKPKRKHLFERLMDWLGCIEDDGPGRTQYDDITGQQ